MPEFTHCFAVPGAENIIDVINPSTGRSLHFDQTLEQIAEREPGAQVMLISDHCAAKAARQDEPVFWLETTEENFDEMLDILPPVIMEGGGFMPGEPADHHAGTGQPRFWAYRKVGAKFYASTRPMTVAEYRTLPVVIGPVKHESTTQPGLFFWAEQTDLSGPTTFTVYSQAEGFPSTEAWDDWFGRLQDADLVARKLARGESID